jgi:hypothetical protein
MTSSELRDQPSPIQVEASYNERTNEFEDDPDSATLGQKNTGQDLRTTITHVEKLGLGFVGTVCRVGYGTWEQRRAIILLMRFDFRAKTGILRFKRAEITISFEPYNSKAQTSTQAVTSPVVRQVYPQFSDLVPESTIISSDKNSLSNTSLSSSTLKPVGLVLKGRIWATQNAIWTITENDQKDEGIPEQLYLATVVEIEGFCKAIVEVKVRTAIGIRLSTSPWSHDDPLIFDGSTTKGAPPLKTVFDKLTISDWSNFLQETPNSRASSSSKVYRVRGIPCQISEKLLVTMFATHGSLGVEGQHISVLSFTQNPYRNEIEAVVSLLHTFESSGQDSKEQWTIRCKSPFQPSSNVNNANESQMDIIELTLDTHFKGFTALGKAPLETNPQVE